MNFLALKTKLNKRALLLGIITATSLTGNIFAQANPEDQIANILERCLFAKNEKKPFTYYVDELIRVVNTNKNDLETRYNKPGLADKFIQDMTSIKNNKNAFKVGSVLSRYKTFMPPSLKQKKLPELLKALKFRLAITADGNLDKAIVENNESYLNAFIAYFKLLFESSKEYFTHK